MRSRLTNLVVLGLFTAVAFFSLNSFAQGRVAFTGASITQGFRASQSLQSRFNTLLAQQSIEVQQKVKSKKSVVALDYFFPTNFGLLRSGSEEDFRNRVELVLTSWLQSNDIVMVGLIPEWSELSAADQAYLQSANGRAFSNWFAIINRCCSARAKYVNARIKQLASVNSKLVILDWTRLISAFRLGRIPHEPTSLFGDIIHLNNSGQAVLFHYFLGPVFQTVWQVRLNF
jgi:hypothetical protein